MENKKKGYPVLLQSQFPPFSCYGFPTQVSHYQPEEEDSETEDNEDEIDDEEKEGDDYADEDDEDDGK